MRLLEGHDQAKARRGDRQRVRPVKTLVAVSTTATAIAAAPEKKKEEEGESRPPWDGNVYGLEWLDRGGSALIFAVDDARVAKVPLGSAGSRRAFEREREVYRRLNARRAASSSSAAACEFVLRCWETEVSTGLVLERCAGSVRQYLREERRSRMGRLLTLGVDVGVGVDVGASVSVSVVGKEDVQRAVRWSYEVAHGLEFLHQAGIIHSDLGCQNILLSHGSVKLADFAGSALPGCEGGKAMVDYAVYCRLPGVVEPDCASDLFALASVMYEMVYAQVPYADLRSEEIERNFRDKEFPCLKGVGDSTFSGIIESCWLQQDFKSAKDVAERLGGLLKTRSACGCCGNVPEEQHGARDGERRQKKEPRVSVVEISPGNDGHHKRTSQRRRVAPQNYKSRPKKKEPQKQPQSKSPSPRRNRKVESFWGDLVNYFSF